MPELICGMWCNYNWNYNPQAEHGKTELQVLDLKCWPLCWRMDVERKGYKKIKTRSQ